MKVMGLPIVVALMVLARSGSGVLAADPSRPENAIPAPVVGPELEDVPGPAIDRAGLPAAAAWPAIRYERPMRLMAIVDKRHSAAAYQRIARRLRAVLEIRYLAAGDDRYHVNDKWIEPNDPPTMDELIAASKRLVIQSIAMPGEKGGCDVIFCRDGLDDRPLQEKLLQYLQAGGVVVACGNTYPPADSPLGGVWPAKARPQLSWTHGGAVRSQATELAGVPVEHLGGHDWMPLADAAPGSVALATGEAGAMFYRKVGKGTLLFVPSGPISRRYDAIAAFQRKYDHDEIWLRAWDQVLHSLVGEKAAGFPIVADLRPAAGPATAGKDFSLSARIVNRGHAGPLVAAVHVTAPHGKVVYAREDKIDLAPGDDKAFEIRLPIAAEWGSGMYPVYLTLGDPAAKKQLHQAMELIAVEGLLDLSLRSEQPGYRLGAEARLVLSASAKQAWKGELRLGIFDFRGRLLGVEEKTVQLGPEKQQIPFAWRVMDHGVRVDAYWAMVDAVADGKEHGRAETRFYKYEPWSTRNEYQWSTWAGIACASPSLVPPGMRLMGHAGMNALGYPGRGELYYAAERWGWRYYNEGVGTNTFSPVIEYENEAEIEAALVKEAARAGENPDLVSAAFVLGSVGEEAGFKNGWGTRYYWDTPVAPEKACRAFHWFLKQKYPGLAEPNAAWRTAYRSWDDVKLTKEFSVRESVKLEADGWAHPKQSPLGEGVSAVSLAPYLDTAEFYDWYYDQIIAVARRILRRQINPVTQTMSSAPTIGSARYDVRMAGPGCWNESQWFSIMDGPEPGFGLIWGHFDWSVMTDNMFWGFLLTRCGHNNYWVDVPLMFNNDLTHTRASFAMRQWTHRLAGHERIILDSRQHLAEVGILEPSGQWLSLLPKNMVASLQVALSQAGFGLGDTECLSGDDARLRRCKIVFAIGRQAVDAKEAERLDKYVQQGGTLVFTPGFASQTPLGTSPPVIPGNGLAEKWDFRVPPRTTPIPQYHNSSIVRSIITIGDPGSEPGAKRFLVSSEKIFREQPEYKKSDPKRGNADRAYPGYGEGLEGKLWRVWGTYDDGLPSIASRRYGKGQLIFLNATYQSHHYIQWVTPTDDDRQGFFGLVNWFCSRARVDRPLWIQGDPRQTLHVALKQFTDPTGKIRYVVARTNGEVPWTNIHLGFWDRGQPKRCYDVLDGAIGEPTDRHGSSVDLRLQPGAGKLLAYVSAKVESVGVKVPAALTAGQSLPLTVKILDAERKPVPGSFPLVLEVTGPNGPIAGITRSFSAESGGQVTINTALNDPPGDWQLTLTDGITGLCGTARLRVTKPEAVARAPRFVPWGQPSEIVEPAQLPSGEFPDRLGRLAQVYLKDHSGDGWMTKQFLGYHYDFFPGTRHDLLRPLLDVDWRQHAAALRQAIADGQTLVLTGEDLGIHPGSGLSPYPHYDARQFKAIVAATEGARWSVIAADGDTIAADLGKGRLILCRESIDAAGNTNPELARWQQRWLAQLGVKDERPVATPDVRKLVAWWRGLEPIADLPRTVTWFQGNQREVKLSLTPGPELGPTFALILPPTGKVTTCDLTIQSSGAGTVAMDIGCGDSRHGPFVTFQGPGVQSPKPSWASHIDAYLSSSERNHAGPYRDGSGWRIVPIRVTSNAKIDLVLSGLKVTVR